MPITAANLTSGSSGVDGTVFTTASVTPGANRLILLALYGARTDANPLAAPTISGNGLTWEQVVLIGGPTGNVTRGLVLFRAMGSAPSAGAITITWPTTMGYCFWTVEEFDGVNTGGSDGSAAVVQSATGESSTNVTSGSVTLGAFANAADDVAYAVFAHHANEATTPEAGYTELSDQAALYEFARGVADEWRVGEDTAVTASWTTSSQYVAIAIEVTVATPVIGALHGAGLEWWR